MKINSVGNNQDTACDQLQTWHSIYIWQLIVIIVIARSSLCISSGGSVNDIWCLKFWSGNIIFF